MFQRLDCACLHTDDLETSLTFLTRMGLAEAWRLERTLENGRRWRLVGLDFPDRTSSQLVLSTHPDRRMIDIEIRVADVRQAFRELSVDPRVSWLAEPFPIEEGHVAVMTAPDGNVFVLIGG
jgi:catechol 2,3-dioxygenase-like lactoylglutathione lyase family enzyme